MTEYSSLEELKKTELKDRDWRQSFSDRDSHITIVAPHGKTIEPVTELIAKDIAADQFNLFIFEGLRRKQANGHWLHVPSEKYYDPDLEKLQKKSQVLLSIHGAKNRDRFPAEKVTHMGGKDEQLRDLIWNALDGSGFEAILAEGHLAGVHDNNFVNRNMRKMGVQLEISRGERDALVDNTERRRRYVAAIREVLLDWKPPRQATTTEQLPDND